VVVKTAARAGGARKSCRSQTASADAFFCTTFLIFRQGTVGVALDKNAPKFTGNFTALKFTEVVRAADRALAGCCGCLFNGPRRSR
jgi:hypothetical protein